MRPSRRTPSPTRGRRKSAEIRYDAYVTRGSTPYMSQRARSPARKTERQPSFISINRDPQRAAFNSGNQPRWHQFYRTWRSVTSGGRRGGVAKPAKVKKTRFPCCPPGRSSRSSTGGGNHRVKDHRLLGRTGLVRESALLNRGSKIGCCATPLAPGSNEVCIEKEHHLHCACCWVIPYAFDAEEAVDAEVRSRPQHRVSMRPRRGGRLRTRLHEHGGVPERLSASCTSVKGPVEFDSIPPLTARPRCLVWTNPHPESLTLKSRQSQWAVHPWARSAAPYRVLASVPARSILSANRGSAVHGSSDARRSGPASHTALGYLLSN